MGFQIPLTGSPQVTATAQIGRAYSSHGLQILACALAACLVLVWMIVFGTMLRCLWRRQLLWPKAED